MTVELTNKLESIDQSIVELASCPGLFCPTIVVDGILTRIRTPGGIVSNIQLSVLAQVMERSGCSQLLITNRANVQLRSVENLTEFDLNDLQNSGLAAKNPDVDHLRNVMISPMAGLESGAFDVVPALREIERYVCDTPKLAALSAKFSIGIDGGELVSVRDRANDVWLVAENAGYRLFLGDERSDIVSDDVVGLVSAVADRYLEYADQVVNRSVKHRRSRKPRLRDVIECIGKERFLDGLVGFEILENKESWDTASHVPTLDELGKTELLHSQADPDRIALEIVCPLGKLTIEQINGLIAVLEWFDLGEIRLTPWQTLIIPNVLRSSLNSIKTALAKIPLNPNANHPARGVVACSGKSGCASAATHAQEHAQQLISQLAKYPDRSFPSIHVSGCEKLCAQPKSKDTTNNIVLVGCEVDGTERYNLEKYGLQYGLLCPDDAIDQIITSLNSKITDNEYTY